MKACVLMGSKQEIAEKLTELDGEVREAIVFIEEAEPLDTGDIFAEMEPYMVAQAGADDTRVTIYERLEGE